MVDALRQRFTFFGGQPVFTEPSLIVLMTTPSHAVRQGVAGIVFHLTELGLATCLIEIAADIR